MAISISQTHRRTHTQLDHHLRDGALLGIASVHPVTKKQGIRFLEGTEYEFPFYQSIARRFSRLEKLGQIKWQGRVLKRTGGRPEDLFCTYDVKSDWLLHEWTLSEWFLYEGLQEAIRGPHVDPYIRPDAEITWRGSRLNIEMDMGTERYAQILERFKVYRDAGERVLWVTLTDQRREAFMKRSEMIDELALFNTLGTPEWFDAKGKNWRS